MKIGLIQSRGIGDIIIALPIAKYFHEQGHEVYWPIDERFISTFRPAAEYANFIPFKFEHNLDGFIQTPTRLLKESGCDRVIPLYSYLSGTNYNVPILYNSLKFDEYKYAVAGVPFNEKWKLTLQRDNDREKSLSDQIVKSANYVVVHQVGSNYKTNVTVPSQYRHYQRIEINEATDNVFDWLSILENAKLLVLIDSCFANLVDQLGFSNEKYFLFRSEVRFTPVLRGSWRYFGVS